jgi:hypothetical protein
MRILPFFKDDFFALIVKKDNSFDGRILAASVIQKGLGFSLNEFSF